MIQNYFDTACALDVLVPAAEYTGALNDNSQVQYETIVWLDERDKPTWDDIKSVFADAKKILDYTVPPLMTIDRSTAVLGLRDMNVLTLDEVRAAGRGDIPERQRALLESRVADGTLTEEESVRLEVEWAGSTIVNRASGFLELCLAVEDRPISDLDEVFRPAGVTVDTPTLKDAPEADT